MGLGQLSVAISAPPAHHCQVTSANSLPLNSCRTIPHMQLAVGTTCHRLLEKELGRWANERVGRAQSGGQGRLIFTHPDTAAAQSSGQKKSGMVAVSGVGGRKMAVAKDVPFSHCPPLLLLLCQALGQRCWGWQRQWGCENGTPPLPPPCPSLPSSSASSAEHSAATAVAVAAVGCVKIGRTSLCHLPAACPAHCLCPQCLRPGVWHGRPLCALPTYLLTHPILLWPLGVICPHGKLAV